jgi:hypothetical protein
LSSATNSQNVLPIPRKNVWHRKVQVNPNKTPHYVLGGQ